MRLYSIESLEEVKRPLNHVFPFPLSEILDSSVLCCIKTMDESTFIQWGGEIQDLMGG